MQSCSDPHPPPLQQHYHDMGKHREGEQWWPHVVPRGCPSHCFLHLHHRPTRKCSSNGDFLTLYLQQYCIGSCILHLVHKLVYMRHPFPSYCEPTTNPAAESPQATRVPGRSDFLGTWCSKRYAGRSGSITRHTRGQGRLWDTYRSKQYLCLDDSEQSGLLFVSTQSTPGYEDHGAQIDTAVMRQGS